MHLVSSAENRYVVAVCGMLAYLASPLMKDLRESCYSRDIVISSMLSLSQLSKRGETIYWSAINAAFMRLNLFLLPVHD